MSHIKPESKTVEPTDEELVRRFLAGEAAAFTSLVERHQRGLRGFLWTVLCDRHLAEDVLQEVFFIASRRLGGYRFESRLSTWLHKIAAREALRTRRRMQCWWRKWVPLEMVEPRVCLVSDPSRRAEALDEVLHYLSQVPPRPRSAYSLWIQGFGYEEIGEILAARPGTIASWIHRAKALIADRISAAEGGAALRGNEADAV